MRPSSLAVASAAVAAVGVMGFAYPAHAEAPAQQGWWTQANPALASQSGLPVPAPPAPADVPANGLLVEGGSSAASPTAYAALAYQLPATATVGVLTLIVAPQSATTPNSTLRICPLTNPALNAEQGGPMTDAPAYDCTHSTTAHASPSGNNFQFRVSTLASNGTLAVALLPTAPTDRVVFNQAGADSLTVAEAANITTTTTGFGAGNAVAPGPIPPTPTNLSPTPTNLSPVAAVGAPPTSGPPTSPAGDVGVPATQTPSLANPPTTPTTQALNQPPSALPIAVSQGMAGGNLTSVIVVLAGLAVTATLWAFAGRTTRPFDDFRPMDKS
jgi:hypothetical protein